MLLMSSSPEQMKMIKQSRRHRQEGHELDHPMDAYLELPEGNEPDSDMDTHVDGIDKEDEEPVYAPASVPAVLNGSDANEAIALTRASLNGEGTSSKSRISNSSVLLYAWSHTASSLVSMRDLASRIREDRADDQDTAEGRPKVRSPYRYEPCELRKETPATSPEGRPYCPCEWDLSRFYGNRSAQPNELPDPIFALAYFSHLSGTDGRYVCIICYRHGVDCKVYWDSINLMRHLKNHEDDELKGWGCSKSMIEDHLHGLQWLLD